MSCLHEASSASSSSSSSSSSSALISLARTSLSSFATSFRSPKMFSRSFTMHLICRLTRTLLTPPSAAAALTDILRSGARHGCAARLLVKITHVDARMLSSDAEESRAARRVHTRMRAAYTDTDAGELMNPEWYTKHIIISCDPGAQNQS